MAGVGWRGHPAQVQRTVCDVKVHVPVGTQNRIDHQQLHVAGSGSGHPSDKAH